MQTTKEVIHSISKESYPLDNAWVVINYYKLRGYKQSEKYFERFDLLWEQKYNALRSAGILDSTSSLGCLDVGTGPGILAWMLKALGHKCNITDVSVDSGLIHPENIKWFQDIRHVTGMKKLPCIKWNITNSGGELPRKLQRRTYGAFFLHRTNFDIGWKCDDYVKFLGILLTRKRKESIVSWVPPQHNYREISDALKTMQLASKWDDITTPGKRIVQYHIIMYPGKKYKLKQLPAFAGKYYDNHGEIT